MFAEGDYLYGICLENMYRANKRWGVINSDFDVTEDTPVGMFVAATEGVFIVDGVVDLVEAADYAIAASHATLERIDSLVYDASAGTIQVVTGTAAAAPNPTALTSDQILLALIEVAHTVTTILDANIHVFAQIVSVGDMFGDATDGEVSISAAINIGTSPKQYKNLTIVSGGTLQGDQNAYPIFIIAKEYIWIKSGGALTNNGRGSTGGNGGGPGVDGGDGTSGLWGTGGDAGTGGNPGSGGDAKGSTQLEKALEVYPLSINDLIDEYGGGGGGGGAGNSGGGAGSGGGGGNGGGLIILIAPLVILESGATISVTGNAGGAGTGITTGAAGGGGGAGGTNIISGITITDSGITKTITGGAGGAGFGGWGAGSAGGSGKSIVRDML